MSRLELVILDRDGVLNANVGNGLRSITEWRWLPGALTAISLIAEHGCRLMIVTNQANIGRGLLSTAELACIHRAMLDEMPINLDPGDVFHCPHRPDVGCACRKPRPGMVLAAIARARGVPERTLLIGDHESDIAAGAAAGCWTMHVQCGRGTPPPDPPVGYLGSATGLLEAVRALRSHDFKVTGHNGTRVAVEPRVAGANVSSGDPQARMAARTSER